MTDNLSDLERQLAGYGLTTANIVYRLPDLKIFCKSSSGRNTTCFRGSQS